MYMYIHTRAHTHWHIRMARWDSQYKFIDCHTCVCVCVCVLTYYMYAYMNHEYTHTHTLAYRNGTRSTYENPHDAKVVKCSMSSKVFLSFIFFIFAYLRAVLRGLLLCHLLQSKLVSFMHEAHMKDVHACRHTKDVHASVSGTHFWSMSYRYIYLYMYGSAGQFGAKVHYARANSW